MMKKIMLSISLLMAMTVAIPSVASAQSQKGDTVCRRTAQNCPAKKCQATACDPQNCPAKKCQEAPCKSDKCYKEGRCPADKQNCRAGKPRHHKQGKGSKKFAKGSCPAPCRTAECRPGADGRFAPYLFDGIQLTDSQKADIEVLRGRLKEERKNFNDATKARAKAEKKEMRENCRKKYDEGMKGILTEEQYAKYQENKARMTEKRGVNPAS